MRFLIIKTSSLGDIVQAFPVVEYLKRRFPDAEIDWVVEKRFMKLVQSHKYVAKTIAMNAKEWKKAPWKLIFLREIIDFIKRLRSQDYTAVFDLQGNAKSAFVTMLAQTQARVGFGWKTAPERINCCVTKYRSNPPKGQNIRRDYLFIVQSYFKDHSTNINEEMPLQLTEEEAQQVGLWQTMVHENSWLICPGSNWQNKQLQPSQLEEFLDLAYKKYAPSFVFLSGSDQEQLYAEKLVSHFPESKIADRLSPAVLQHVMSMMKLVVSMDSFPLHLAGTTSVPTYSFFGPSQSFKYRPLSTESFSFQGSCPYEMRFEKRCPKLRTCETGACLRNQDVELLFQSFRTWWEQVKKHPNNNT